MKYLIILLLFRQKAPSFRMSRDIDDPELEVLPELPDDELKYRIEKHLFLEMTSNITIGFADQDLEPLSVEEQREFFEREDVRGEIRFIVLKLLQECRELGEDEAIMDDWYRELIYDETQLGKMYVAIEATRPQGNYEDIEDMPELPYSDYIPQFPRPTQ